MDYDNTAAVDFFLSAVRNHRATTVQEMVNLYETEMDQRRTEAGQQEMLNQREMNYMLQQEAQQINANTASTSRNVDWIARDVFGKRNGL